MKIDKVLNSKKMMMGISLFFMVILIMTVVFFVQNGTRKENVKKRESGYSDEEDYKKAVEYQKQNEIIKDLPIIYAKYEDGYKKYREFRIDGGKFNECKRDFCLVIRDATGGNRELAIEEIKKRGYDVKKYEILYKEELIKKLK